jgi:hypothetical protein
MSSIIRLICGVPQGSVLGRWDQCYSFITPPITSRWLKVSMVGHLVNYMSATPKCIRLISAHRCLSRLNLASKISGCIGAIARCSTTDFSYMLTKLRYSVCATGRRQCQLCQPLQCRSKGYHQPQCHLIVTFSYFYRRWSSDVMWCVCLLVLLFHSLLTRNTTHESDFVTSCMQDAMFWDTIIMVSRPRRCKNVSKPVSRPIRCHWCTIMAAIRGIWTWKKITEETCYSVG